MTEKVLIVDDEPEMLRNLSRILMRRGYAVTSAQCGEEAWKAMEETMFDLVISDMAMDDMNGIELLRMVRTNDSTIPFIIITGVGTIESAVEAIKLGAFHYITKPFKSQEIEILAQRALEYGKLNRRLRTLSNSDEDGHSTGMIIGVSKPITELINRIEKISDSMASVLIMGETGTGKSLLAGYIHRKSSRRNKPFLIIDCAALTETLLESELFGHVKGAFTGAIYAKRGLLEEGQGGTIFLDEIGEIGQGTQVKLLRAIQDGVIKPVGGNQSIKIDVRFISASSRDFEEGGLGGKFREELFYRLAVVPLSMPPLRERRDDIPLLIDHFLYMFCKKYKKKIRGISQDVLELFMDSPWKGNIRELANILERGVLLAEDNLITLDCLLQSGIRKDSYKKDITTRHPLPLKEVLAKAEKRAVIEALKITNNNRSETARILGITRRALYYKIAAYKLGIGGNMN